MALLKLQDGTEITNLSEIREKLSTLNIELSHWPIEKTSRVEQLLNQKILNDEEKEELLKALDSRFEEQKKAYGYQSRDLIVLHSDIEGLDTLLAKFDKTHTHDDDEVRYIVDGAGYFGFIYPDKSQVMLKVEAEEYIRVPANSEHWFVLDTDKRIKAVRYFTSQEGWVAKYTGTEIQFD
jgi:1,2-dihydroxy-3-keto-5-methylthiopentene dioxygenase